MIVSDLYNELNRLIPSTLSCEWDNDGIMCLPNGDRQVSRVLLTLDITDGSVEYAVDNRYDLIISHHPLIFRPLRSVTDRRIISLIKADIAAFSFHTRFDKTDGGVNTVLAELLKLKSISRFGDDGLGVIGELDAPINDRELASRFKLILGAPFVEGVFTDKMCSRIAVVGGDGDDYIDAAHDAKADMYLSGALSYNDMTDASRLEMSLAAFGHYYTEQPSLKALSSMVGFIDSEIKCDIYECNAIQAL